jgi:hypothetical protein
MGACGVCVGALPCPPHACVSQVSGQTDARICRIVCSTVIWKLLLDKAEQVVSMLCVLGMCAGHAAAAVHAAQGRAGVRHH